MGFLLVVPLVTLSGFLHYSVSRLSLAFSAELGASMRAASTMVPGVHEQTLLGKEPVDLFEQRTLCVVLALLPIDSNIHSTFYLRDMIVKLIVDACDFSVAPERVI